MPRYWIVSALPAVTPYLMTPSHEHVGAGERGLAGRVADGEVAFLAGVVGRGVEADERLGPVEFRGCDGHWACSSR
jgi:hypothetical protein